MWHSLNVKELCKDVQIMFAVYSLSRAVKSKCQLLRNSHRIISLPFCYSQPLSPAEAHVFCVSVVTVLITGTAVVYALDTACHTAPADQRERQEDDGQESRVVACVCWSAVHL